MVDQIDIYENYISAQFSSTHDLADIKNEYKKFGVFIRHNFIKYFPKKKDISIVDIGCGLGHTLAALNRLGYTNVIGVDLSGECVKFCQENGFRAEQSDALTYLEKNSSSFNVIIMNDIIEHFEKDKIIQIIRACHNALAPGGVLIIKTFNASNPFLGTDARYYDFTHTIGFTQTSLRQVLLSGGFYPDKIRVIPSNIYVFYYNPLNYLAWGLNSFINLFLFFYCKLNGRLVTSIFTKNIISISYKENTASTHRKEAMTQ